MNLNIGIIIPLEMQLLKISLLGGGKWKNFSGLFLLAL